MTTLLLLASDSLRSAIALRGCHNARGSEYIATRDSAQRHVTMNIQDWYQAYENAFEESFVDDGWTRIEQCFTEDAVY